MMRARTFSAESAHKVHPKNAQEHCEESEATFIRVTNGHVSLPI